VGKTTIYVKVW